MQNDEDLHINVTHICKPVVIRFKLYLIKLQKLKVHGDMMKMTAGKHLAKRLLSESHTMHVSEGWDSIDK